jgi:hypothetical protein
MYRLQTPFISLARLGGPIAIRRDDGRPRLAALSHPRPADARLHRSCAGAVLSRGSLKKRGLFKNFADARDAMEKAFRDVGIR